MAPTPLPTGEELQEMDYDTIKAHLKTARGQYTKILTRTRKVTDGAVALPSARIAIEIEELKTMLETRDAHLDLAMLYAIEKAGGNAERILFWTDRIKTLEEEHTDISGEIMIALTRCPSTQPQFQGV